MKNLFAAFAKNTVFANILLFLILFSGALATKFMVRETFPEFSLDIITIEVPYPGADPEEVEEGICRKIEEAIDGEEGINQYTTHSYEGVGTASIEVKENYDVNKILDQVRSKINAISTFPIDAEKPIITELIHRESVILLSLAGDMSERRLKEWAEKIQDEIQQIPAVSKASASGFRAYEIAIEISEVKLRKYGLTFEQVTQAISQSNLNLAGGTIKSKGEEIRIRTIGRKYTGKELSKIVVIAKSNGTLITLDKIATINDGFEEDPISSQVNGKPAVFINVFKTEEEDSIEIAKAIYKFIEKTKQSIPEGLEITVIYDSTDMLRSRINLLIKNGFIGLILVFLLLWMFLDLRLSIWAGMGIPISLGGGLVILWMMGDTINMISLFGFIMVLGIVVDDAIVVGEAIFVHRQNGKGPLQAAVDGVCEVGMPVVAAVATTIVAFLPLAYIKGIMGKFIAILPVVVISCLMISLIECIFLLPAHLSDLPDPKIKKNKSNNILKNWITLFHNFTGKGLEWFIEHLYVPFLKKALHWRYISFCIAIAVLMITIGVIKGGFLKFEAFPDVDGFIISANVEFPSGTPAKVTENAIKKLDQALISLNHKVKTLSGEPLVKNRMSIIGQSLGEDTSSGPNFGGMYAILIQSEKRGIHSKEVEILWEKEVGTIPGVKSLTFEGMSAGPPGSPIEIWIQGHDMDKILAASNALKQRLAEFEGVYQISSDFSPGKNELKLELKPEARTLGLTVDDLAKQIYAGYYGQEALRLQRGRDDIRVKVRYTADERKDLSNINNIRIRTKNGHEVPLLSVANIKFGPGYSTIIRTDGMRRVAVSADVDTTKANANEILAELSANFFIELTHKYPGLYIALQGEKKKNKESFSSLFKSFPIALIGIFTIIATIFRSYTQPFIIMFTVPFGIIGAIIGHVLMGYNLSLLSIFGMVALTGVVVNDAIVLIERINENLAEGMPFLKSIYQGGARRFRAILLTTLSTVGGLLPLIAETDFQARFLIPMALSLAAGVAFATLLTLVLIPNLLVILNDLRRLFHKIKYGTWPTPEEVEPATYRYNNDKQINTEPKSNIVEIKDHCVKSSANPR